jgi:hypothetical protein
MLEWPDDVLSALIKDGAARNTELEESGIKNDKVDLLDQFFANFKPTRSKVE